MINRIPALMALALAPTLAFAAFTQIDSYQSFPEPFDVVEDFDQLELAEFGITASGYSPAGGSLTGNADAPMAGLGGAISGTQTAEFFFFEPINAAGLSVADIDFSNDDPVTVILNARDAAGLSVARAAVVLEPANTLEEENAGARFVGLESDVSFQSITLSVDSNNVTFFDTLTFGVMDDTGGGCSSAPSGSPSLVGLLALGLGLALRRRQG